MDPQTEPEEVGYGVIEWAEAGAHWVSLPVSEFENLHESNRLLRQKIAQLERGYAALVAEYEHAARRWQTVVAATHANGYGHTNPYLECPSAICVAARMGK